jgi:trans-2,3-dihydro-3-hydroxyanthranilate isomerase
VSSVVATTERSSYRCAGPDRARFALVDVFTDVPLAGNPLVVVPDGDIIGEEAMRRLAREFNQSETTFLCPPTAPDATVRLRSFTPTGTEVVGAGHNALGAWWWLAVSGHLADTPIPLRQQLGDRSLGVVIHGDLAAPASIAMAQGRLEVGGRVTGQDELGGVLGLPATALVDPAGLVASTGVPHLLVHVRTRQAVDEASPDARRLRAVLAEAGAQGCYLYALDPVDASHTAYTRFFNPTAGIREDPATGSAAGPLAAHLAGSVGTTVWIEQGHSRERPSLLELRLSDDGVELRGRCVVTAEGAIVVR